MPRYDGTGPMSQGPMTGRGMGPCGKGTAWGGRGRGWGRGFSRNNSMGYGRWPWWIQTSDNKEEVIKDLEAEKADIESAIEDLKKSN